MHKVFYIESIISGGQTGVDRAALDFALKHQFPCGGYCPAGRKAEDGVISKKYPLKETASVYYQVRTRENILSSDGTLIITGNGFMDNGTILTKDLCRKLNKPCFIAAHPDDKTFIEFRTLLQVNHIRVLNVAGCRESAQAGIYDHAVAMLHFLLLD